MILITIEVTTQYFREKTPIKVKSQISSSYITFETEIWIIVDKTNYIFYKESLTNKTVSVKIGVLKNMNNDGIKRSEWTAWI